VNWIVIELRFIHIRVTTGGIQWMVRWWVLVHYGCELHPPFLILTVCWFDLGCHKGAKPLLWATYFYRTTRKAEGRRESISRPPAFIYNLLAINLLCILMRCVRYRRLLLRFRSTLWSFGDRHPVIWIMEDVIVSFASSSPVPWVSTPSRNFFLGVEICLASL